MGCNNSKVAVQTDPVIGNSYNGEDDADSAVDSAVIVPDETSVDDALVAKLLSAKSTVNIQPADPQAFSNSFVQQRQQAIDNRSYRSTVDAWQPSSLEQLASTLKSFAKDKPAVDQHWLIFYWVARNIEYDTVAFFTKKDSDQSAEGVFRGRKGVCEGYANIYKYLCDALQLPCEKVSGYSKGYGFDDREGAPTDTDHAWNAVQIDQYWYLMESTWGAGSLNDNKLFQRQLQPYYFLARPNEMIYHHLPENDKWQLLQKTITMEQYMQMPKLRPEYFQLQLELLSPCNQAHVDLQPQKSYAVVLVRAPADVRLMAGLHLNGQKVEGAHRVIFNAQKQVYCCLFAPSSTGKHKVMIYGRRENSEDSTYHSALELRMNVKQLPANPISFAKTWDRYFDLGLDILAPRNTSSITLANGVGQAQILVRAPDDVVLLGRLDNEKGEEVKSGSRVYYYRRKNLWRCCFAPNQNGQFVAMVMAKKKSDTGKYSIATSLKINAKQIPTPSMSYPYTWQTFYDFNLKIEAPVGRADVAWPDGASFVEVLIRSPDDVILSCDIQFEEKSIENGSLAQYSRERNLWQLLFAPERTGLHELVVFAKQRAASESKMGTVVKFNLNVTKLRQPMKFPEIYTRFQSEKCQILTPMDGILKKGANVPLHCIIPGATKVNVQVDSKWLEEEGYNDPTLQRQVTVGSKDVVIYASFEQGTSYNGVVKYTAQ